MVARTRKFLQQGLNMYVPAMSYSSDMIHGKPTEFSLGTPALGAAASLSSNAGAANVGTKTFITPIVIDATYGRVLRLDFSGVPGNTPVVRLFCEDYLGQPVVIDFTGSAAATTTTASASKAVKRILAFQATTPTSNAVNVQLGTTDLLGLPYKGNIAYAKEGNPPNIIDPAGIFAVWVKPVLTDPATVSTGDPRGTYDPIIALNGSNEIIVAIDGDPSVNSSGNGGLHGIRHFGG